MEFQIKLKLCFAEYSAISSPLAREEMEATHIMIKPFKLFYWKAEIVIQLRAKGLDRVTMGTEVEPNSVVEKAK